MSDMEEIMFQFGFSVGRLIDRYKFSRESLIEWILRNYDEVPEIKRDIDDLIDYLG